MKMTTALLMCFATLIISVGVSFAIANKQVDVIEQEKEQVVESLSQAKKIIEVEKGKTESLEKDLKSKSKNAEEKGKQIEKLTNENSELEKSLNETESSLSETENVLDETENALKQTEQELEEAKK